MKAKNLQILKENGFHVPAFTVVERGKNVDLSFSGADFFAVRSSFSLEDGCETSFAGQFKTLLRIPRDQVPDAVQEVRESYGRYRGARIDDGRSSVIIQESNGMKSRG